MIAGRFLMDLAEVLSLSGKKDEAVRAIGGGRALVRREREPPVLRRVGGTSAPAGSSLAGEGLAQRGCLELTFLKQECQRRPPTHRTPPTTSNTRRHRATLGTTTIAGTRRQESLWGAVAIGAAPPS